MISGNDLDKALSAALAGHVAEIGFADLPERAVTATKRSLLDAIGVTLGASGLGEGCRPFIEIAREDGGVAESTIIGLGGVKIPAASAAFANGAMAHALDFEDAHDGSRTHPNAATIPAALAVAEARGGVTGEELVTAIALGADLVCRLGLALKADPAEFGWYTPAILGAFGAATAAGKLMRLTPAEMVDAFSLTLCQSTCTEELRYSPRSMVRAVRDAFAARAGVTAARLAKKGVIGFDRPFEGTAGLFALYARGGYDPERLMAGLGETFHGADVSFKPWPACRGTHSYIEAALHILAGTALSPQDIAALRVRVHPVNLMLCEPAAQKQRPATAIDAKFSVPFVLATALCHRRVDLDLFEDAALRDPDVLALASKVVCEITDRASSPLSGTVRIETKGGAVHESAVDHPKGSLENPMDDGALIAKFKSCAGRAAYPLSDSALEETIEAIMTLESAPDIAKALRWL